MPTENRSSNPREQLDALWRNIQDSAPRSEDPPHVRFAAALAAQPAEQHQGAPVAWFRDGDDGREYCEKPFTTDWNPLYTHADPGEVERLRQKEAHLVAANRWLMNDCDTLRAQLAERDALLREALKALPYGNAYLGIERALSASAEPSAQTPMPAHMEAACDKFDWTPEDALRFYAEGKHFDTDNGRTRILCTGAIASHALKGMSKEYADLKGSEQGEQSAPKFETCKACHGEGVIHTGIDEVPTTLCNRCDGSGNEPSAPVERAGGDH